MSRELSEAVRNRTRELHRTNPNGHEGQAAYTALEELRPDLACAVRGADCDPYYGVSRLPAFWSWLEEQPNRVAAPV